MKPRIFIGSSVEGLSIAYSIHQNLQHDAEVTVWDQGVFELSATAIESLTKVVNESDFAVFVFNPDDAIVVRGSNLTTVRDNVIFELGLFIGRLGRDRVFVVAPEGVDLHVPSDLLGITTGRYETNRSDGSYQAATGPSCHQIRQRIKQLGSMAKESPSNEDPETEPSNKNSFFHWYLEIMEKRYDSAIAAIQKEKESLSGGKLVDMCAWELYATMKTAGAFKFSELLDFLSKNTGFVEAYLECASICGKERYYEEAIKILEEAKAKFSDNPKVYLALSSAYINAEDYDEAIKVLRDGNSHDNVEIAIALARNLEKQDLIDEAFSVVEKCLIVNQGNEDLRYKYSLLAKAKKLDLIALGVLHELTLDSPKSSTYWGHLGNACLDLTLYDRALYAYKKAQKCLESYESSGWITSNIGNLLNNKDLPTEAIEYFQKTLELEPSSEYAHSRLASAMKKKEESDKDYKKKCSEGILEMRKRFKDQSQISTPE